MRALPARLKRDSCISKKLASPIELNDAKIELLNQEIEYEKNNVTQIAITRGIQILTEEE